LRRIWIALALTPLVGCSVLLGLKDPPPDVDGGPDALADVMDGGVSDAISSDVAVDALDGSNDPQHCGVTDRMCPSGKCVKGYCVRRVFVTSATHTADVGGISLSNLTYCGPTVTDPLFPNTSFFVWLSDTDTSVRDTFESTLAPFVLPDGTPVANDFNAFTNPSSGGLLHAINMTEDGGDGRGFYVWTGTGLGGYKYDGGSIECMDWHTETGQDAVVGTTDASDSTWTLLGTAGCSTQAHFYCVER